MLTFEALAESGENRFASLDFKLWAALVDCIRSASNAKLLLDTVSTYEARAM